MNEFTLQEEKTLVAKFTNTNQYVGQVETFTFKVNSVKLTNYTIIFDILILLDEEDAEFIVDDTYCGNGQISYSISCTMALDLDLFLKTKGNPIDISDIDSIDITVSSVTVDYIDIIYSKNDDYSEKEIISTQIRIIEEIFDKNFLAGIELECLEKQRSIKVL